MSTEESMQAALTIAGMAPVVDVAISCAFGSPYEGEIAPSLVAALAARCSEAERP
jgi:hypothetical protein